MTQVTQTDGEENSFHGSEFAGWVQPFWVSSALPKRSGCYSRIQLRAHSQLTEDSGFALSSPLGNTENCLDHITENEESSQVVQWGWYHSSGIRWEKKEVWSASFPSNCILSPLRTQRPTYTDGQLGKVRNSHLATSSKDYPKRDKIPPLCMFFTDTVKLVQDFERSESPFHYSLIWICFFWIKWYL